MIPLLVEFADGLEIESPSFGKWDSISIGRCKIAMHCPQNASSRRDLWRKPNDQRFLSRMSSVHSWWCYGMETSPAFLTFVRFCRNKVSNKASSNVDFENQTYMWRHYNWLWYQICISCMIYINCTWQDNASYCSCCAMKLLLYPYALHFDTPSIIRFCLVSEVAPKEQTTNIDFLILHYIQYKTKQLCALIYWFALHFEFVQVSESMCREKSSLQAIPLQRVFFYCIGAL